MTKPRIERVMVVGHGVMGRGILLTFARAGFDCALMTRQPAKVHDAPKGVRVTDAPPEDWQPDLVVESIVEAIEPKLDLFRRLDRRYAGSAILASNTSSLPLQRFTDGLSRPDRVVGLHYFQPPETMEFVELTEVAETAGDVVEALREALARAGKQVLHLKKPVVGFLVNRLQHALAHEAYYLIEQGLVDAATIDLVMKRLLAPRMCVTGIMEQKDWSGLDTHALSQRALLPHLHHGAEPSALVQKLHADGHFGVKSGRGFYDWRDRDIPALRRANADKLGRVLALLREFDAAEAD
jgi:3-hydroxybutyryl-CoA dehydrogenase